MARFSRYNRQERLKQNVMRTPGDSCAIPLTSLSAEEVHYTIDYERKISGSSFSGRLFRGVLRRGGAIASGNGRKHGRGTGRLGLRVALGDEVSFPRDALGCHAQHDCRRTWRPVPTVSL